MVRYEKAGDAPVRKLEGSDHGVKRRFLAVRKAVAPGIDLNRFAAGEETNQVDQMRPQVLENAAAQCGVM